MVRENGPADASEGVLSLISGGPHVGAFKPQPITGKGGTAWR
jgi:hypothetical protein